MHDMYEIFGGFNLKILSSICCFQDNVAFSIDYSYPMVRKNMHTLLKKKSSQIKILSWGIGKQRHLDLLISCLYTYSKIKDAIPTRGMKYLHPFLCQQCLLMENFMFFFQYEKTTPSSLR